jgi:hypothetical protein
MKIYRSMMSLMKKRFSLGIAIFSCSRGKIYQRIGLVVFVCAVHFNLNAQVPNKMRGIYLVNSNGAQVVDANIIINNNPIPCTNGVYYLTDKDTGRYYDLKISHPDYQSLTYSHIILDKVEKVGMLFPGQAYFYGSTCFKQPCEENSNRLYVEYNCIYGSEKDSGCKNSEIQFKRRLDSLNMKVEKRFLEDPYSHPLNTISNEPVNLTGQPKKQIKQLDTTSVKKTYPVLARNIAIKTDSSAFSVSLSKEIEELRKYGYTCGSLITSNRKEQSLFCYTGKLQLYFPLGTSEIQAISICAKYDLKINFSQTDREFIVYNVTALPGFTLQGENELIEKLYSEAIDWISIYPETSTKASY